MTSRKRCRSASNAVETTSDCFAKSVGKVDDQNEMHELAIETLKELGMHPEEIIEFFDRRHYEDDVLRNHIGHINMESFSTYVCAKCRSGPISQNARILVLLQTTAPYLWEQIKLQESRGYVVGWSDLARLITYCQPFRNLVFDDLKRGIRKSNDFLEFCAPFETLHRNRPFHIGLSGPFLIHAAFGTKTNLSLLPKELTHHETFGQSLHHPDFGWSALQLFMILPEPDFNFLATPDQMLAPKPDWPVLSQQWFNARMWPEADILLIDAILKVNNFSQKKYFKKQIYLENVAPSFQKSIEHLRIYRQHVNHCLSHGYKRSNKECGGIVLIPPLVKIVHEYAFPARITDKFLEECEYRNRRRLSFEQCPSQAVGNKTK